VHINRALLPGIFASIKGVEFLEVSFRKQGTENVFGVMSRGSGGDHLVKGSADQRISLKLSFNGGMQGEVRGGTDGVAIERGLVRSALTKVSEFEGIVNVFEVQVFPDDLGVELAFVREIVDSSGFDSCIDETFMRANKLAQD
jgi:hypothetical protein